jgi:hypothetical protein
LVPEKRDKRKTIRSANGIERQIFVNLPYIPWASDKIAKILRNHNINSFYTSQGNLKDVIGGLKDKIPMEEKAGIYEVKCGSCEGKYRGKTCRRIADRYAEHERAFRLKQPKKSAIAMHT